MPELLLLGLEVPAGVVRGGDFERQPFRHRELVPLDAHQFPWIVREQPHRPDAQILQDLDADPVVALVGLEPQALVRLDGVQALVL